jgi:FlaA1/EpsC-like NDP-sugar epimerase
MMEYNPGEAIKNNFFGTMNVANLAHQLGSERFVLISTDKAVNPSSVMGATKRLAELYVQTLNGRGSCRFVSVRFGNVLSSAGSVIPLFREQISRGGPVTVTHPDMERYFMTIPEASRLVLEAAGRCKGGEVMVLDMGEPIKITTLAEQMIRLSGFEPRVDIEITFTGIRPGEKLYEELVHAGDMLEPTGVEKISPSSDVDEIKARLAAVLPEYRTGDVPATPPRRVVLRRQVQVEQPLAHALEPRAVAPEPDAEPVAPIPLRALPGESSAQRGHG